MKERLTPADASTLIYLAKADGFRLASASIGPMLVPPSVWRESVEAGERRGAAEVPIIRTAEKHGFLRRASLTSHQKTLSRRLARTDLLGAGESEVVASAAPGGRVLLDESRATRVAGMLGYRPFSTLFLPVLGHARGVLAESQALEFLHRLSIATGARSDVVLRLEAIVRGMQP